MGTDYELILKIEYGLITLKICGDNSCGTLFKYVIDINKKLYNFEFLKYSIYFDRLKFDEFRDGLKKVKMIIDLLYPKSYDEKEIEIFEQDVNELIKERWGKDSDCDSVSDECT